MKRVLHTTLALLLIAVLFVGMAPTAQAELVFEGDVTAYDIPVSITVTGSQPVPGAYVKMVLTAFDGAPLDVEGSEQAFFYDLALGTVKGSVRIPKTEMGIYTYQLAITEGTYVHADDLATYSIEVYNLADGYLDQVVIWNNADGKKPDSINLNFALTDIKVAKKWVDQESIRPNSVSAELLLNDERPTVPVMVVGADNSISFDKYGYADITLSSKNSWQSSWSGVDADLATYSVKEVKVPAGYVATYKYADSVYTITNTGALIQTGQLNWPIPVLCGAGCLFLLAGLLMLRRKEEENA